MIGAGAAKLGVAVALVVVGAMVGAISVPVAVAASKFNLFLTIPRFTIPPMESPTKSLQHHLMGIAQLEVRYPLPRPCQASLLGEAVAARSLRLLVSLFEHMGMVVGMLSQRICDEDVESEDM